MSCCVGSSWYLFNFDWLTTYSLFSWLGNKPPISSLILSTSQKEVMHSFLINKHFIPHHTRSSSLHCFCPSSGDTAFRINVISFCSHHCIVLWQVTTLCTLVCMFPRATTGEDATDASLITRKSGRDLNRIQKDASQMGRTQMTPLQTSSNRSVSSDKTNWWNAEYNLWEPH